MAFQPEVVSYDAGIYQLEVIDPVDGGVGAVSNKPLLSLANRTAYLYQHVTNLESGATIPPGIATINSPNFTGTPTAPTPALGDNSTKIATTAFVQGTVNGRTSKSVAGSSNVTLTAVEAGAAILTFTGAITANIAVIVPSASGQWVVENNTTGAFSLTVKTASGSGIAVTQGQNVELFCDGTNIQANTTDFPSIALTGVPTAPTAAASTNTTQIATTAYVLGQASSTTPAMDGTAAVGTGTTFARADHVHPTDTSRAPLASPTFTGTPAAPTATAGTSTTQIATTAFVATSFAPLASPALTGTPTAPTAAVSTNTTQLATTAFVIGQAATAAPVMDGTAAVGTSTLFARQDHVHASDTSRAPLASPTFTGTPAAPTATAGTSTTQLATTAFVATSYAPLASPALTGTPTAPTAAQSDNSTKVATTAFVTQAGMHFPQANGQSFAASGNITVAMLNGWGQFTAAGVTMTLPALSGVQVGATITVLGGAYGGTVAANGSDTIVNAMGILGNASASLIAGQQITFVSNGAGNGWYMTVNGLGVGAFGSSLATSGYQKFPSGLIIQWGSATSNSSGLATLTLPIAFPSARVLSLAQYVYSGTGVSTSSPTANISSSSTLSTLYAVTNNSAGAINGGSVYFFAIGW